MLILTRNHVAWFTLALAAVAACSGGGGGDGIDPCTTCPEPDAAALRLKVEYDAAARTGLQPAGFRAVDVARIDIVVAGPPGNTSLSIVPPQDAAFLSAKAGSYAIAATAFGLDDLVLFTAASTVTLGVNDTANVTLRFAPSLGVVSLDVDGQTTGTVNAVAGEAVPFTITVRNSQGRAVPHSIVVLTLTTADFGSVSLIGGNTTDAQGQIRGTFSAPHRGAFGFSLTVDNRPITAAGQFQLVFATGVNAGLSTIIEVSPSGTRVNADGVQRYTLTALVLNAEGDPLPGVPVTVSSDRNAGTDPLVDILEPAPGYESGKTDALGLFRFTVRSSSSSFIQLNPTTGRLFGNPSVLAPVTVRVDADGVFIEQLGVEFHPLVSTQGGSFSIAPRFVTVNDPGGALVEVRAVRLAEFGGGPAASSFVEFVDGQGKPVNGVLNLTPEPGFTAFRTNAAGVFRARLRSSVPVEHFLQVRVDARQLAGPPVGVEFKLTL